MKNDFDRYRVRPKAAVKLSGVDPSDTGTAHKHEAETEVPKLVRRLGELQNLLYAGAKQSVLVILQAMDAGGKDGTISHIFSGVNPQGCTVTSFKVPSTEEAAHDFLWRVHHAVPPKGIIGIFNRSQYEDVLVVRVHELVPKSVWKQRYDQINAFEELLTSSGTRIVKFFLHIDRDEQKKRLEDRIHDPAKHWKISPSDLKERKLWDSYQEAYEDVLHKCSTESAPWYIVPANRKWFRNLVISTILVETMEDMKLSLPQPESDVSKLVVK